MSVPHLRIARPTDQLDTIANMYREGLGLEVLGRFDDHDGFDGVMLGEPDAAYHIELTHQRGHDAGRAPTKENLLVFYVPDEVSWTARCDAMRTAGFAEVAAHNPYWDRAGRTFEDPDGYRVVIQRGTWPT